MAHKRKDLQWKDIINEFSKDFVRFFFPNADIIFDLEQEVISLNTETSQSNPATDLLKDASKMDGLLRIPIRSEILDYLFLMVEVQGYNEYDYPEHVFTNFVRLLDAYPESVAVKIIYTETSKDFQASSYNYSFLGTRLTFTYEPYIIHDQDPELLSANPNPVALAILTTLLLLKHKTKNDEELYAIKKQLLQNLKERNLPQEQEAKLLIFITFYVLFKSNEMQSKFEKEIELTGLKPTTMTILEKYGEHKAYYANLKGIEQGIERGIEQGIERGIEQGFGKASLEYAGAMLKDNMDIKLIHKYTNLSIEALERLKMNLKINQ